MNSKIIQKFVCPKTGSAASSFDVDKSAGDNIIEGSVHFNDKSYPIIDGIPHFTTDDDLIKDARFARDYYAQIAETYDENVDITFSLYNEDESVIRNRMIDLLNLKPNDSVLEVSAGTGKDSELISDRLDDNGEIVCFDISPEMLKQVSNKLKGKKPSHAVVVGTAVDLPFKNDAFDALYCFAGIGHFPNKKKALKEMARVVKPGGKVVFSEKNIPPWLRKTEYAKILINNNPMFADDNPLDILPIEARNAGIRWILGNVHYVVDYEVGIGEPQGNFDLVLPGARGGTFNTRYYGKLEGVTKDTKQLALKARDILGLSMHDWLNELITKEAKRIIDENEMDKKK
jgi:ubiquinone/menaquinone biosynthesis C-methylase UbiE